MKMTSWGVMNWGSPMDSSNTKFSNVTCRNSAAMCYWWRHRVLGGDMKVAENDQGAVPRQCTKSDSPTVPQ